MSGWLARLDRFQVAGHCRGSLNAVVARPSVLRLLAIVQQAGQKTTTASTDARHPLHMTR